MIETLTVICAIFVITLLCCTVKSILFRKIKEHQKEIEKSNRHK